MDRRMHHPAQTDRERRAHHRTGIGRGRKDREQVHRATRNRRTVSIAHFVGLERLGRVPVIAGGNALAQLQNILADRHMRALDCLHDRANPKLRVRRNAQNPHIPNCAAIKAISPKITSQISAIPIRREPLSRNLDKFRDASISIKATAISATIWSMLIAPDFMP
ncbi:hypothetical protein E4T56_gene14245 [Termitomyces sp. T112]|nr:hypothetical protein E4T56_gene14245 [Termitomyces sp. T112]